MRPRIDGTEFGSITVEGQAHEDDILIRLDGHVRKRKKELSKEVYGTSHIVSLAEAEHIYEDGAQRIIFGTGQIGLLGLSDEAREYFEQRGCQVDLVPTGDAMRAWNEAQGNVIGVFHVTC